MKFRRISIFPESHSARYLLIAASVLMMAILSGCANKGVFQLPPPNSPDSIYNDFIRDKAPSDEAFAALQAFAGKFIETGDFDRAKTIFSEYSPLFYKHKADINRIIQLFDDYSGNTPENIGQFVNSSGSEIFPVFSFDGETLYFTGRNRADNSIGDTEDIFAAVHRDNAFETARPITGALSSTQFNDAINSISADGKFTLLFTNREDPMGNNAFIMGGTNAIIEFPRPVNSIYFDSDAVMTPDGASIIFVSDRPGGVGDYRANGIPFRDGSLGNTDIYIAHKIDGEWKKPLNLGEVINTPFAERTPCLIDGITLVFSSQGHSSIGGLDIFVSFRKGDGWTNWTEPLNLGLSINSPRDSWGFVISPDRKFAYFSSDRDGGFGGFDIYRIPIEVIEDKLQPPPEPEPIVEEKPIPKPDMKQPLVTRHETSATPKESIPEPIIQFQLTDTFTVRFEVNGVSIRQEFYSKLDSVAIILRQNPLLKLRIDGFTDNRGPSEYNLRLSRDRAQSVADFIAVRGISRDRLQIQAHGILSPIADNTTDHGRALNRRVECRLFE